MKASYATWPLCPPKHCLLVRDSKMGKCLRTAHHGLLTFISGGWISQLSLSKPANGHFPVASFRRDFATPSSVLLAPPISFPCPNANGGIGSLVIGS